MKRIIGHRGWASLTPENTIHGFKMALEDDRVWAIECDVHLTKDNKIVVAHDPKLGRTCNGTGWIAEHTYEELLQYDFGGWFGEEFKDTKIMLYSDLLKLIDGKKRLVCEIKSQYGQNDAIVPFILEESKGVPKKKNLLLDCTPTIPKNLEQTTSFSSVQFSSVQSLSRVQLFATP